MSAQDKCPHCGVSPEDHDFQELARYCYPRRLDALQAWQARAVAALRDIVRMCLSEQAATAEEIVASRVDLTKALGFVLELLTQVGEQAQAVLAALEPVGKEQG